MSAEWIELPELLRRAPNFSERTIERLIAAKQITCRQRKKGCKRAFNWAVVERELALLDTTTGRPPLAAAARAGGGSPQLVQLLAEAEAFVDRLRQIVGKTTA